MADNQTVLSRNTKVTKQSRQQVKELAKQNRYFISNINSVTGYSLVEALRNDNVNDENPHIIIGSLNKRENNELPKGALKIIDVKNCILILNSSPSVNN